MKGTNARLGLRGIRDTIKEKQDWPLFLFLLLVFITIGGNCSQLWKKDCLGFVISSFHTLFN